MNAEETKAAAQLPFSINFKDRDQALAGLCMKVFGAYPNYEEDKSKDSEPVEVEVWVHPDGSVESKQTCHDPEYFHNLGCTLRRATIHPETK